MLEILRRDSTRTRKKEGALPMGAAKCEDAGFVLTDDMLKEMRVLVDDNGLDDVAEEVGMTPLTLAKAIGGFPMGARTVLMIDRFLTNLAKSKGGEDDEDGDDGQDEEDGDDDGDDGQDEEDGDDD